jgi:hypothetical protein
MTSRSHLETQAVVLERMALSRADLLTAQRAARLEDAGQKRSLVPARLPALIATAPNVTLLVAVFLGSLIIGPKKIASVVVRNGLMGWIAKTVRRLAGR